MAKKDKKEKKQGRVARLCRDERFGFAVGIVLFFGTLYLTLALVSFLFTGAADQSIVTADGVSRAEMKRQIANWTGLTGAVAAEWLVNGWLGIAVFALPVVPFAVSFRLFRVWSGSLWRYVLFPLLFVVWAPLMFDFFFGGLTDNTFVNIGGAYGAFLSDFMIANIGWPGTLLVIIGSFVVFAVFAFSQTVPMIRRVFASKSKIAPAVSSVFVRRTQDAGAVRDGDGADGESAVRIGDDIVPEEWVDKGDEGSVGIVVETVPPVEEGSDDEGGIVIETVDASEPEDVPERVVGVPATGGEAGMDAEVERERIVEEMVTAEDEVVEENLEPYDPTLDLSYYRYPTLDLLKDYPQPTQTMTKEEQQANQVKIITTLKNFGIGVKKIFETIGPTITLYEIVPEDGVRISKIKNLEADIMLSLAAIGIRIIAPMPGKGTIGIEVPNSNPRIVSMYGTIASKKFQESKFELPVALGRTITNEVFTFDLCKMPHLLVAGATGQGKSVGLNAIITSLLYKKHPSQLKFVLVDPKKVEFNIYSEIERHFLAKIPDADEPVITDTSKVVETLNSLCKEMDARYDLLKLAHARNIREYNEKFIARRLNPLKGHKYLPYIVVIVDEFGDLIMTAGKEVELPIARIAQLARAVGIHMIIATQRPSVNIITGIIKANFPARIAFKVSSGVDSKTILDGPGAQQLIGRGDLLFSQGEMPVRVQCAFVDTPEVEEIVKFIGDQQGYPSAFELPEPDVAGEENDLSGVDLSKRDPYFDEVARYVVSSQQGSTSNIQRKFEIGFNRAGRIMDQLEVAGVVGPAKGSKPREVLIMTDYELDQLLNSL